MSDHTNEPSMLGYIGTAVAISVVIDLIIIPVLLLL